MNNDATRVMRNIMIAIHTAVGSEELETMNRLIEKNGELCYCAKVRELVILGKVPELITIGIPERIAYQWCEDWFNAAAPLANARRLGLK